MNDQQFLELVRTLDATLGQFDHQGLANGQTARSIITALCPLDAVNLSAALCDRIQTLLGDKGANVRGSLKDVYMFPQRAGEYDPWTDLGLQCPTPNCRFTIRFVDGKVYAQQTSGENFTAQVFASLAHEPEIVSRGLQVNPVVPHVTLMNSDEVVKLGAGAVEARLRDAGLLDHEFAVEVSKVLSTVSRDWPVFSACAVAQVSSPELERFMALFQDSPDFKRKSCHVTFAQTPRAIALQ
jgi:hypothetical protein